MKKGLHPQLYEVTVTCACGNSWQTRSTRPELRVDLCSKCHPFFTGEQRIVDTAGQVDRFVRKVEVSLQMQQELEERRQAKEERRRARLLIELPGEGEEEAAAEKEAAAQLPAEEAG